VGEASRTAAGAAGFLPGSLVGADLSLSRDAATLRRAMSPSDVRPFLFLLYGVPMLVLAWRIWSVRTREQRGRASELREVVSAAERALAEAKTQPARDAAPKVLASLRAVTRTAVRLGCEPSSADRLLIERIETEGYSPAAADQPLAESIIADATAAVRRWSQQARENGAPSPRTAVGRGAGASTGTLVLLLTALILSGVSGSRAENEPAIARDVDTGATLGEARVLYQSALEEEDRVRRTRGFADAERVLRPIAEQHADRPELLADWGNAALGAQDPGRAVLAYRRALRLDPTHARARKNLGWLRSRAPRWLPKPPERTAVDRLFFWHGSMSVAERHLFGAVAFAVGLLLLAPWPLPRAATVRKAAVLPLLVWMALTGSALVDRGADHAAVVVIDGVELRSADSEGAPPALSAPLPAGAELAVLEARDAWTRVGLADGTRGWLKSHTIERVVP
jgi:hypothetical protein